MDTITKMLMLSGFVFVVASFGAEPGATSARPENVLVGRWIIEKMVIDGVERQSTGGTVVITTNTFAIQNYKTHGKDKVEYSYETDAAAAPHQISLELKGRSYAGDKLPKELGIYRYQNERLEICYGSRRPSKFASPRTAGINTPAIGTPTYMVLRRAD